MCDINTNFMKINKINKFGCRKSCQTQFISLTVNSTMYNRHKIKKINAQNFLKIQMQLELENHPTPRLPFKPT